MRVRGIATDLVVVGRGFVGRLTAPPEFPGAAPTVRRLVNLWRVSWESKRFRTSLRSYPVRLCIEASGACNLACPHCFTGAGEVSRPRATLSLEFFRQLLAELGSHLWQIEFHNWGEPLLNKNLPTMVAEATARGVSTIFCTNFSVPFDAAQGERLVRSGLKVMGLSIDGATQKTYEQYRVHGDLDLVLRNCRLMVEAKRRLGSDTPKMIWGYHTFAHNWSEIDAARRLANDLGVGFHVSRGRVFGPDWDPDERVMPHDHVSPMPCYTLYHTAVVYADGSMAPCRGSFYRDDDMGRIAADGGPGAPTFRDVWNGERFRTARRLFRTLDATPEERRHICHDCPARLDYHDFVGHLIMGAKEPWQPRFNSNERYNYFWNRRLAHRASDAPGRGPRGAGLHRPRRGDGEDRKHPIALGDVEQCGVGSGRGASLPRAPWPGPGDRDEVATELDNATVNARNPPNRGRAR